MLNRLMTSIEKKVYGQGAFPSHECATRSLLKFCMDHNSSDPALSNIRACLAALESGERSNAIQAYKRVSLGKGRILILFLIKPSSRVGPSDDCVWLRPRRTDDAAL